MEAWTNKLSLYFSFAVFSCVPHGESGDATSEDEDPDVVRTTDSAGLGSSDGSQPTTGADVDPGCEEEGSSDDDASDSDDSGEEACAPALLLHEMLGNVQITPGYLADNLAEIETSRPFLDGVFVQIPESFAVMSSTALDPDAARASLAPLATLAPTRLKHNYLLIFNDRPGDVFDDWSVAVNNWGVMAGLAAEFGFAGIAFDNEQYFGEWMDYPEAVADPQLSLAAHQDRAIEQGRHIMQEVVTEFPAVRVLHLHGPYLGEPLTDDVDQEDFVVDFGYAGELGAPFFAGMVDQQQDTARAIDGGQIYCLRTAAEFERWTQWRRFGMPSIATNSAFIAPDLREAWSSPGGVAYGIYNQAPLRCSERTVNAASLYDAVLGALFNANAVVWLYFEETSILPDGVPVDASIVEAIAAAKAAYRAAHGATVDTCLEASGY